MFIYKVKKIFYLGCSIATISTFIVMQNAQTSHSYSLFGSNVHSEYQLFNSHKEKQSIKLSSFPKWTEVVSRYQQQVADANALCKRGEEEYCQIRIWESEMAELSSKPIMDRINIINRSVNQIEYSFDQHAWGISDYWATPMEFIARGQGDCEDYAITKYFALIKAGVPAGNMRIVVLDDMRLKILHAVLAVYIDNKPYILDNRTDDVKISSNIVHYRPIYSINENSWWRHS